MALEQGVPLWGCNLKNKWAVRPLGIWLLPRGGAGHWGRIILGAGVHRLFCVAESATGVALGIALESYVDTREGG